MKADQIIKNAKIYTSDKDRPLASALAVKDGKFIYVGDEAGLAAYDGDATDLGGKFIIPGIIDSHVHVTTGVAFEYTDLGIPVMCSAKKESLDYMMPWIIFSEKASVQAARLTSRYQAGSQVYCSEKNKRKTYNLLLTSDHD